MFRTLMLTTLLTVAGMAVAAPNATSSNLEQRAAQRAPFGYGQTLDSAVQREYVRAGGASGYLYRPAAANPKSRTAILIMHYAMDYSELPICSAMAKHGYSVLCVANGSGTLDDKLVDVYAAMRYLRQRDDIDKIILWGHSGGATLLSAYQMIAENGVQVCQGADKIHRCPDYLNGMPKADGVIWADSNWGNATMTVLSLDPAVKQQNNGLNIQPKLNLYSAANGFRLQGNSNYSPDFIRRFQHAVAQRNQTLLNEAQNRLKQIEAGKGTFSDDEPFVVAGAGSVGQNNKMIVQDNRLLSRTRQAWPLVHPDGSETVQIIHSVRPPKAMSGLTARLEMGASDTTVRGWLTDNAIRLQPDFRYDDRGVYGVEWTSTYASTAGNVTQIRVPSLMLGMTGNYEFLAAELLYNQSPAGDKQLAFIEGASHMYDTCTACESYAGQYGNTLNTLTAYADKWLQQRKF